MFNHFNYQYFISYHLKKAIECIENDDLEGIKKLLEANESLGSCIVYKNLYPCNIYQYATKEGRDEIAYLLFMADPQKMRYTICQNTLNNISIASDILGDAVINKRYKLVQKLLSIDGEYKFNINGYKNTSNMLNNCYYVNIYNNTSNNFLSEVNTYVSSPFLISILLGDEEMYTLLKSYNPYFNIENKNCKFHFDQCPKAKIQDDLLIYFNTI